MRGSVLNHASTHGKRVGAAKPCLGREKGRHGESKAIDTPVHGSLPLLRGPGPGPLHGVLHHSATPKNPLQSAVRMP